MSNLLPANASKLEKNIEQLGEKITQLAVPFIDLHRIEKCPEPHLPWLAWEYRVEYWRSDWSALQKRQAINESSAFNQLRGTRSAIESLLSFIVPQFQLIAWYEFEPKQQPFTFVVNIPILYMLSIDQLLQILTAVEATKSARDTYSISANVKTSSPLYVIGATVFGETVYISSN